MDDPIYHQTRTLQAEIDYLSSRLKSVPEPVVALCLHARNFYWTVTRILGLGHLHDGSKIHAVASGAFDVPIPAAIADTAPRIFFDLTSTYASRYRTGIQRVMRELCRVACEENLACPVIAQDGRFVALPDKRQLRFAPGDRLLLLDSSWPDTANVYSASLEASEQGADITLGLYDMIPALMPGYTNPGVVADFLRWLDAVLPLASGVVAISRSSAEDLVGWLGSSPVKPRENLKLGWFPLGADFLSEATGKGEVPTAPAVPVQPYFLTVGTLEPRKGHAIALDAFEQLWAEGADCAYVVAGREGWNVAALKARIISHPQYGRRLFWRAGPGDAELESLYKGAYALLLPTMAEGFGLPLVEAAHYGLPAIVSDISVFREIAGDQVDYFRRGDSAGLADRLRAALKLRPAAPKFGQVTWRESAHAVLDLVARDGFQSSLPEMRQARAQSGQ